MRSRSSVVMLRGLAAGSFVSAWVVIGLPAGCGPGATEPSPGLARAPAPSVAAPAPIDSSLAGEEDRAGHEERADWASRYDEWFAARSYPRDDINWDVYREAHEAMHLARLDPPHADGPFPPDPDPGINDLEAPGVGDFWQYLGPTDLDVWTQEGQGLPPVNGRVNAMAYDPTDPDTIYAATGCGGVWKTTNGGQHWFPRSDRWDELYTSAIAVGPEGTVYVGTGDYSGRQGVGIGLLVSEDGGVTWEVRGGFTVRPQKRITDIVIDPEEPNRITVATAPVYSNIPAKVYQSENFGQSFSTVINLEASWSDLSIGALLPPDIRYYYAAGISEADNEVWRSGDRGETWAKITDPIGDKDQQLGIAASKLDWNVVYMLTPNTPVRKVWRSTLIGDGWSSITNNLPLVDWGQSSYNYALETFVRQTSIPSDGVLIANIDVFVGPGDGSDWVSMGSGYIATATMHVDNHAFAVNPADSNEILVGNDGGVYRYDYNAFQNDGVATSLGERLGCVLANRIAVHPTDPGFLMGGTQDNGTPLSTGNLQHWFNIVGGDTGHVAINQQFPQIQYACPPHLGRDGNDDIHIVRTDDFWNVGSGSELITNIGDDNLRHGAPIVIDPNSTNFLYFASNYLYRYDELTGQWDDRVGGQLLSADGHVRTFAIAPANSMRIYTGSNFGEVWTTDDFGVSWDRIDQSFVQSLPERAVSGISVDPFDSTRVLVSFETSWTSNFGDGIWECEDVTADPIIWERRTGTGLVGQGRLPRVPVNAIARHPTAPSTHWFVGTDLGVWGTDDEGETWFDMTRPLGLPVVAVTDLRAQPQLKTLFASTYGRGFWRIRLKSVPSGQIKAP